MNMRLPKRTVAPGAQLMPLVAIRSLMVRRVEGPYLARQLSVLRISTK